MHVWGDDWEHWGDIHKMVERCYELAEANKLDTYCIKEKFGTLRWYIADDGNFNGEAYRKIYETLVAEYPHLKAEILVDADWFKEYLVGLVPQDDCDHPQTWCKMDGPRWCAVCGKTLPHDYTLKDRE
jgi:hypothetical protein